MPVYLVRHAKAGSRDKWNGADERRPLSTTGWAQSNRLGTWLGQLPIARMLSSPYLRCIQTLEPAAGEHGLKVEVVPQLAEGSPTDAVLALLDGVGEQSVLCTHGDVLTATLGSLVGDGLVVAGKTDFRKGVTWVLERFEGRWVRGRAYPPR